MDDIENKKQKSKSRLSLTKSQLQRADGVELLALCQTITADGTLSDEEINELKNWLNANRSSDLPSIEFLITIVERIIAEGKVTKEKKKILYKAIESILPSEIRKQANLQRQISEAEERERSRSESEAQKQREREIRELNRPEYSANFMIAGASYEGRPSVIRHYVREDDKIFLIRDRNNRYSRNAIEIRIENGMQIGFVPEDEAECIAHSLDEGYPYKAFITIILTGRHGPIPVVQVYLYRKDATIEGISFESSLQKKKYSSTGGEGIHADVSEVKIDSRKHGFLFATIVIGLIFLLCMAYYYIK